MDPMARAFRLGLERSHEFIEFFHEAHHTGCLSQLRRVLGKKKVI